MAIERLLTHDKKKVSYGASAICHLNAAENLLLCKEARKALYKLCADYCLAAIDDLEQVEDTAISEENVEPVQKSKKTKEKSK